MARKPNRTGRDEASPHFITIERSLIETPAWRALSLSAKAVYIAIRFEWHGPKANNNGKLRLSVRQAAEKAGIGINAAARAFQDLQAKGFLHVTEIGALGFTGEARGPSFEITDLLMPGTNRNTGRRLYAQWSKGHDFPVIKHNANNPKGKNGGETPTPKQTRGGVQKGDVQEIPVTKSVTPQPQKSDVRAPLAKRTVTNLETSLITIPTRPAQTPSPLPAPRLPGAWRGSTEGRITLRLPPTSQMIS